MTEIFKINKLVLYTRHRDTLWSWTVKILNRHSHFANLKYTHAHTHACARTHTHTHTLYFFLSFQMFMVVLWDVMLCRLVGGYQCFWGTVSSILTVNMEAIFSSKMMVTTYKTTWCHNPGDNHQHFHCHKNLKFHIKCLMMSNSNKFCLLWILTVSSL
jgi:hypothetical protein